MKKNKINERPGQVVCICEKSGNISMHDPSAWRRTIAIERERAKEGRKERDDDD